MTQRVPFPNRDTVVCISIASRPSNFGCTLHNAGYRALGLNYLYKSFATTDVHGTIAGVRAMGIRGCSVSMPFKQTVIPELDQLDDAAKEIGAVNTIVNDSGVLTGYNTDAFGAATVLKENGFQSNEKVLLLGAGGVAKAILYALTHLGATNIALCNRTPEKIDALDNKQQHVRIHWEERNTYHADWFINATPMGMSPHQNQMPLEEGSVNCYGAFFDVVVTPPRTKLTKQAARLQKKVIHGYQMSFYQAVKQFELYTGHPAPQQIIQEHMQKLLNL